jgi:hypothetical protein
MEDEDRWIALIKGLRVEFGISLVEAERIALRRPAWRRWVERQINSDKRCHRAALAHIRQNGSGSLIELDGAVLRVRAEATEQQ